MAPLLDAYATIRCEVRLQLSLDDTVSPQDRREPTEAGQRRIDSGRAHEAGVLDALHAQLGDDLLLIETENRSEAQRLTTEAISEGRPAVGRPWLPPDRQGHRRGRPDLLVRTSDGYLPIEIKLHLLSTSGGGSLESSPLSHPFPESTAPVTGRRFRKGTIWFDDSLQLAHYYRMLESMGVAGQADGLLGGIIDGSSTLWWIDLDAVHPRHKKTPLAEYDARFSDRLELASTSVARNSDASIERARDPWWHKDCLSCPYEVICHNELESVDDVSLVRWSSTSTLSKLRDAGLTTRASVAALDLTLADLGERLFETTMPLADVLAVAEAAPPDRLIADVVGRRMGVRRYLAAAGLDTVADLLSCDETARQVSSQIRDLGRLIRRARAHLGGGVLRQVDADSLIADRADVEVDVDMESYGHATYLWGAYVTTTTSVPGVEEGYRPFVTFGELTDDAETAVFADFWAWLMKLRAAVRAQGKSFRAYCFWRAAEEGQMRRAVAGGGAELPTTRELERFFASEEWVDLHQLAKDQLVTEGPLGLKALAHYAGFEWRDEDPSGEASIGWYEEARGPTPDSARARLLAYNEDDVLATRALREWLAGPARLLPHVDDITGIL